MWMDKGFDPGITIRKERGSLVDAAWEVLFAIPSIFQRTVKIPMAFDEDYSVFLATIAGLETVVRGADEIIEDINANVCLHTNPLVATLTLSQLICSGADQGKLNYLTVMSTWNLEESGELSVTGAVPREFKYRGRAEMYVNGHIGPGDSGAAVIINDRIAGVVTRQFTDSKIGEQLVRH